MLRSLGSVGYLALALLNIAACPRAFSQEVIHGADSLFVVATIKIAWAVQKGANEETTVVVLRIVNSAGHYTQVRVDGVDPFSNGRKVLVAARPLAGSIDLTIPRTIFAEFPSCEVLLYQKNDREQTPSLVVYYLGIPDTTPEFPAQQDAEAYLTKVLGK